MRIIAHTAPELYRAVMAELLTTGAHSMPRGKPTREVLAAHLTLTNPHRNIITQDERRLNYPFMVAEWLFIMTGANNASWLTKFNTNIGAFADRSSIMSTFAGAYGPKVVDQLPYVIETLMKDPDSRQAVITIWRERPRESLDIPCTVSMQFFIRADQLHCITYMRSNDVWLGLPYDLFNFTQIQRTVAHLLGRHVGRYHHMVGSLHLYETDVERAQVIAQEEPTYVATQAPFEHLPLTDLTAAFIEVASTHFTKSGDFAAADNFDWSKIIRAKYGERLIDDDWRNYLNVLLWRFDKRVEPGYPWHTLTTARAAQP